MHAANWTRKGKAKPDESKEQVQVRVKRRAEE